MDKRNLQNISDSYWPGTKICQKKYLHSPQWLRNIKTKKRPFWKLYKPKEPQLILDGGWHFSFLTKPKDLARILTKINVHNNIFAMINRIHPISSRDADSFQSSANAISLINGTII